MRELLAMARLASTRPWPLRIATLAVTLLLPAVASAGWGDENWGEMVWGAGAPPIPAMSAEGLILLAILLLLVPTGLLARRGRGANA
jgi:hypothetical protein